MRALVLAAALLATAAAADEALPGSWVATAIGGNTVAAGVASTLTLAVDGTATGNGGCNRFRGGWKLDGGILVLGPIGATRMACPPPASEQEAAFFGALDATRGFRIEEGALVLLDAGGVPLARLQRAP